MQRTMNAHNLTLANLAPAKPASRFTIGGINCTASHTEVTDGHYLMRVANPQVAADSFPMPDGLRLNDRSAILGRDEALAIAKTLPSPKKRGIPVLATAALCENVATDANGKPLRYVVSNDLETVTKQPVMADQNFPEVDRVIPAKAKMKFAIKLDAALLGALCKQVERMCKFASTGQAPVTMYFSNADSAVLMEAVTDAEQAVTAVLMPMRLDESVTAFNKSRGAK